MTINAFKSPLTVNQKGGPDPILESENRRNGLSNNLSDILVEKPVVLGVNKAQQTVMQSFDNGVSKIIRPAAQTSESGGFRSFINQFRPSEHPNYLWALNERETASFTLGRENGFKLSAQMFYHNNIKDRLTYACTMADGRPLPGWLTFNGDTLTFSGVPPYDEEAGALDLVVIARNSAGQVAKANFTLNLAKDEHETPEEKEPGRENDQTTEAPPAGEGQSLESGKRETSVKDEAALHDGLSVQIAAQGRSGLIQAAQEFLKNIQLL